MSFNYTNFILAGLILLVSTSYFMGTSCQPKQQATINTGIFEASSDVGEPSIKGSAAYDVESQTYTLEGGGANVWADKDQFQFAWKKAKGDFILQAQVKFIGEGVNAHRKIGLMLRDELTTGSRHVNAVLHGDGLTSLQYRAVTDGLTTEIKSEDVMPDVIQIERRGNQIIMSTAVYGEEFTRVDIANLELNKELYAGLFICSHDDTVMEKAIVSNVQFIVPAPDTLIQYRQYLGSHLEIMDMETGHRRIVHSSPLSIQAPNWTVDGKTLIYNSEGKLYTFDIETSAIAELNSGFAINNNNDHVLSFDGKLLGISHHAADNNNRSNIYVIPSTGGEPERITSEGPSYLHGFSPDGEYMIYTAGRNNAKHLNIYRISRTTKQEEQLTFTEALDDGSEYSPDGKYIYFNSARTGTMQIWRMNPDGSNQEQLTFDELNDWFPHISPDGQNMVFISFLPDVPAGDHPFYKHVYIRSMPANGGTPKVIAYLYGGQGTINVPSWSPDGKQIAFVSNSMFE